MHGRCQVSRLQCLKPNLRYEQPLPATKDRHAFHTGSPNRRAVRPTSSTIQSLYTDSHPPTTAHLNAATTFFTTHHPSKSWTATQWRTTSVHSPDTPSLVPEIAFLGRSNTGKSSLLNALLSQTSPPLCRVGAKPGKTTLMHAWSLSPMHPGPGIRRTRITDMEPKLTVLDMPGYGHGSHKEWGADITKYLTRRRQLRRAFVLINPAHGLKGSDLMTLEMLHAHGISHQVVACKCDKLKASQVQHALAAIQEEIVRHFAGKGKGAFSLTTLRDVLAVGALGDGKFNGRLDVEGMKGIEDVRWAVIRAAGLEEYALHLAGHSKESRMELNNVTSPIPAPTTTASDDTSMAVPPAAQPLSGVVNTNKQHEAETIGYSVADFLNSPVDTPTQLKNAPIVKKLNNVGTGMEALLSMTQPSKPKPASRTTFTRSPASGPARSKRKLLRDRRSTTSRT